MNTSRYPDSPESTRRTDTKAFPCRYREVIKTRVVQIAGGSYRSARADGVFELADPERENPVLEFPKGKRKVKVICAWQGFKPNPGDSGARIDVSDPSCRVEVLDHYSGLVIDNIGRSSDPFSVDGSPAAQTASDLHPPSRRTMSIIYRILRDTAIAAAIKRLHNYECQLCGAYIVLPDGSRYAEAHHIQPLGSPHDGPDTQDNILCLCPNHHAACDLGAISLNLIDLRRIEGHDVTEKFLSYHNEMIYRG